MAVEEGMGRRSPDGHMHLGDREGRRDIPMGWTRGPTS